MHGGNNIAAESLAQIFSRQKDCVDTDAIPLR